MDQKRIDEIVNRLPSSYQDILELASEVKRPQDRETTLKQIIRDTEWIYPDQPEKSGESPYCVQCGNVKWAGHTLDCVVNRFLEGE